MGTISEKLIYLNDTKTAIKNAIISKGVAVESTDTFRSYADKIDSIVTGGDSEEGYIRPTGVPNGEDIIANAHIIEHNGTNYYPIYYICDYDTYDTFTFTKTGTGVATGADAFVFSDEPTTLYVGNTTHTFDSTKDFVTSESWKCRYVIMYATEANKNNASGISVNLYRYGNTFEFIGSQYLTLSSTSALFGYTSSTYNKNIRFINLENANFKLDRLYNINFCQQCDSLIEIIFPLSVTIFTGFSSVYPCENCTSLRKTTAQNVTSILSSNFWFTGCTSLTTLNLPSLTTVGSFCTGCTSLTTLNLPSLTTVGSFCTGCTSLTTLDLPNLTTVSSGSFCNNCYSLTQFSIPNTIETITSTNAGTLNYCKFITLPTDFNITGCNFTGATGYPKSLSWFTHLATQLKDRSNEETGTMILGATNIALIPTDIATIISNKNWTLS